MEISLLNVKVTFQKNSVVADDIGNRRNVWEDYYTCHATVSGEGGNEKAAAGLTVVVLTLLLPSVFVNGRRR